MTTALDIITDAAKLIGVIFKSEALSADEANDGLIALNDMLDSWSNDNLLTTAYTFESFPLNNSASYTMGIGGNFNTTRPINIVTAVVRIATVDYPLEIITPEEYQTEISIKSITSPIPQFLTYDNGFPLGTITLYCVPTTGTELRMLSNKPLSNLSSLNSDVSLPPGWKKALKYNLAIDLAAQYGADAIQAAAAILPIANRALGMIKHATAVNNALPLLPSDTQKYSIYGGTPGN